jgi:lipocalin
MGALKLFCSGIALNILQVIFERPSTYYLNDKAKVKVFNKCVKHQSQGHKIKSAGTHRKALSQGTIM